MTAFSRGSQESKQKSMVLKGDWSVPAYCSLYQRPTVGELVSREAVELPLEIRTLGHFYPSAFSAIPLYLVTTDVYSIVLPCASTMRHHA